MWSLPMCGVVMTCPTASSSSCMPCAALPVATPAQRLQVSLVHTLKWTLALLVCVWAVCRLRRARQQPRRRLKGFPVPEDYRAAGVIFYTVDELQNVGQMLLAVEDRKVSLRELGVGSGSGQKRVLLFPQGKREQEDAGFVATARREFIEETGDPTSLSGYLEGNALSTWFPAAKMGVVFCEVPASAAEPFSQRAPAPQPEPRPRRQQPRQQEKQSQQKKPWPLQPVWVDVSSLRSALKSSTGQVATTIGLFHLFPVTRKFFLLDEVSDWLGISRSRRK
ncbi:hypothetical protein AK812_SmicGene40137 [Symbiodinium microadriaticum]|uniref:Uncharacterized protein n=1 Tax=Symbiodinium microadriaticum TaxID=2951 RepID=A0A1Q9C9N6_SYMMI|nr:hypothetical protein AK812_SmicGene40137 [Symbiodinium microadriaticum]CAE7853646.1 unnamed protein product [Symbiodinium microadriaticum]CAE7932907.1 unnamed protein product [Symbiodinium sp. KB8]